MVSSQDITATGGAKTAGADYKPLVNKKVAIAKGASFKLVTIPLYPDAVAEDVETFRLVGSSVVGAAVLGSNVGIGTIYDDD
jgi:hypothetical protein